MFRLNLMLGVSLLACSSAAAVAQEAPATQAPVVPPLDYSLPPGQNSVQPVPPTPVIVTPPPVLPKARPTPKAVPSPTPTARATPRPTPTATPTPEAQAQVTASIPAPVEAPPVATPTPQPVPSRPVPAQPQEGGWLPWGWLALGGMALIGAGAFWWRRRVPVEAEQVETVGPAPTPVPPSPPVEKAPEYLARPAPAPAPPPAPSVPTGTITAFTDRPKAPDLGYITAFKTSSVPAPMLGIEVNPIRAGIAEDAGFVEFQFAMINPSETAVGDMLVSAWILSASPDQDAQIVASLSEPADPTGHNIYSLQPGEHREHQATLGVPFEMLHVVEAGGRRFFAPILLLDARYRTSSGTAGRTSAAYMIGRPNPATGKLAPIYVDRGPRAVDGLAARPYPIAARS